MKNILIKNLTEISKTDISIAGGKGALLGEMFKLKISVPQGFVILTNVFNEFLRKTKIDTKIEKILSKINIKEIETINHASKKIRNMILTKKIPKYIEKEIFKNYKKLNVEFVAVRSSATSEDSIFNAWAGQLETYLNITEEILLENIKKCWSSLFTTRAIYYRKEKKLDKEKISVAVIIQKMIQSEKSGVSFSVDPIQQNKNQIIIEAGFGLGEAIVSGSITPDKYVVSKKDFRIIEKKINEQKKFLIKDKKKHTKWKNLSNKKANIQKLSDKEIIELSKLIKKLEEHYKAPQDIEWAIEEEKIYITQSRPITTLDNKISEKESIMDKFLSKILPKNIYKMSFEFIPLFWNIPIFYFYKNLESKFAPTLLIKHKKESHLIIDSKHIFGYPKEVLNYFLEGNYEILKNIKIKYQNGIKDINKIYDKCFKIEEYTEKELKSLLKNSIKVFQKFFVSTSLAYLDHQSIFDSINSNLKIDAKKIKIILEIDIHKSFELIYQESIFEFKKNYNKDYKSLSYLFTTYSKIPEIKKMEQDIKKIEIEELGKSILKKYKILKKNNQLYKKLYKNLNEEEKKLVDFIQIIKNIRDDRKQYFSKIFFAIFKISGFLLKKWELDDIKNGNVFYFELLKGKQYLLKIKGEVLKRREGYVFYCNREIPNLKPFSGNTKYYLDQLKETVKKSENPFIKGEVAYKGKVSGNVVIAIKNDDYSKINDNSILVTSMTRPEILPYLNKVKAIITDEGGITCHAAIIARELKKPCIIGTKNATQILNNGDLVEINANKGIVILLKNKDYTHFKGNNLTRSEKIQKKVVEMILKSKISNNKRESSDIWELKHTSGCCQIGKILAEKRKLNVELVEIIAVLHDISVVVNGNYKNHAQRSSKIAKKILQDFGDFNLKEIKIICEAINHHSQKEIYTNNPYIEIAKDMDVFDCSLYEGVVNYYKLHKSKKVFNEYSRRIKNVRKELGMQTSNIFR